MKQLDKDMNQYNANDCKEESVGLVGSLKIPSPPPKRSNHSLLWILWAVIVLFFLIKISVNKRSFKTGDLQESLVKTAEEPLNSDQFERLLEEVRKLFYRLDKQFRSGGLEEFKMLLSQFEEKIPNQLQNHIPNHANIESGIFEKCQDTPGWFNGFDLSCKDYSENYCKGGKLLEGFEWTGDPHSTDCKGYNEPGQTCGELFNFPSENCCVCGKKATNKPMSRVLFDIVENLVMKKSENITHNFWGLPIENVYETIHPLNIVSFQDRKFFFTSYPDLIGRWIFRGKLFETRISTALLRWQHFYGGDVLDIGINIGVVSVPVAAFCNSCKVIGIEMVRETYAKAVANLAMNELMNAVVLNVALVNDSKTKTVRYKEARKNMGSNSVGFDGEYSTNATTLDALAKTGLFELVKVVKMDIEGSELNAILGGLNWLKETPPCIIIMESDKIDNEKMKSLMDKYGFEVQKIMVESGNAELIFKHETCESPER